MFNLQKSFRQLFLPAVVCLLFSACSFSAYGQDQDADKHLAPAFAGMITDMQGNPVDDAQISLRGKKYYQANADEFGLFAFVDTIESGDYRVYIKSSKCVGFTDFANLPVVSIDADEPSVKNFQLRKACQVEVKVVDERGSPVACSAYCSAVGEQRHNANGYRTKAGGGIVIGGLDPKVAKYQIGVNSGQHAIGRLVVEVKDSSKISKHTLTLKAGKKISGNILCSDGEPAAGWRVTAMPTWWNFGIHPIGTIISDDGSFQLKNIGEDRYDLTVSIPMGNGMSTSRPVVSDINLADAAEPLNLTLDHPSPKSMNYLEGAIRWVGPPMDGSFTLAGYSAESQHSFSYSLKAGTTDFRVGPIPKGTYRVRVEHPELEVMNLAGAEGLDKLENVFIPSGKKLGIVVKHRGLPVVSAAVVNAETGEKIDRFRYQIRKIRSTSGPNYVQKGGWLFGKQGALTKEVVGPGIFTVSVLADGFAIATSEQVNTDQEPNKVLSIALKQGVSFSGLVVDHDGQPIDGAKVRMQSLSGDGRSRNRSQFVSNMRSVKTEKGKFTFQHLSPGKDSLRIDHPDYPSKIISDLEITEGLQSLKVVLPSGATVYGTVFDEQGKPSSDVRLNFHKTDNYHGGLGQSEDLFGQAITSEDGHYSVNKIPPGKVYISQDNVWSKIGMVKQLAIVNDGGRHQVNLGGTSRLSGTLTSSGKPLANKQLRLTGTDYIFGAMAFKTRTDSKGRYTFFGAPRGHWYVYRDLETQRIAWAPAMEVDVVGEDVDLGTTDLLIGGLTVESEFQTGEAIPLGSRMKLTEYSDLYYFGRDVAVLKSRSDENDPFEFTGISPGDYQLDCYIDGVQYLKRITISKSDIDSRIQLVLPKGERKLAVELRDEQGELVDSNLTLVNEDQTMILYLNAQNRDAAGVHRFDKLPDTNYELHQGYLRTASPIAKLPSVATAERESAAINKVVVPDEKSEQDGAARLTVVDENGVYVPVQLKTKGLRVAPSVGICFLFGPPGEHQIVIEQPGFKPYEGTIKLVTATQIEKAARSAAPKTRGEFVIYLTSE